VSTSYAHRRRITWAGNGTLHNGACLVPARRRHRSRGPWAAASTRVARRPPGGRYERALKSLFLGLGAVAPLVGAVGVANIMIISVLERRSEIGLRRALGATKAQIRTQFLSEAIMLALRGVAAGALATTIYAGAKDWAVVIPTTAWAGGIAAAIAIGAIAGLFPALRAAQLSPTEALRTV
jgi:putative ABC transport system permease protein